MALQQLLLRFAALFAMLCMGTAHGHTIITYPGYRGNNLHTNGFISDSNGLGVGYDKENGSLFYPYGMEWTNLV
jgi:hypothetical protein